MSWDSYSDSLMSDGICHDCAIVSCKGEVWTHFSDGTLGSIEPGQIKLLLGEDRGCLFTGGVKLGSYKMTVLRDQLKGEDCTIDLKTKNGEDGIAYSVTVAKSLQALVIVVGKKDIHGGKINIKASNMAKYLKSVNY